MMKMKNTKRALLMSGLALLMCISMLVGSTFAWFTDSVTSSGNIIQSGKLEVTMQWADGTEAVPADDSADWNDASNGAIFDYDLWEPGYTEVRHIKITNVGNLALQYQLSIVTNGAVSDLADVIDVYYVDPGMQVADRTALTESMKLGTLTEVLAAINETASGKLEAGEDHTITLALKMQETAGNEYQGLEIGTDFSVVLTATQVIHENDSFDNTYDEVAFVNTAAELKDAISAGGHVILASNIDMGATTLVVKKDVVLDLSGNTLSGTCNAGQAHLVMVNNGVTLDIYDTSEDQSGKITYARGANNVGWAIDLKGNLNLYAGTIELTGNDWSIGYAVDVRPNSWGTPYDEASVFTMYGGKIVSSDGAIRVASSSAGDHDKVAASFVMYGGEIEAAWDGIFVQQSDGVYDILSVTIHDGKITSELAPIRVYGGAASSVVGGVSKPMTIVINGGELNLSVPVDTTKNWYEEGVILLGGGMTKDILNEYGTVTID